MVLWWRLNENMLNKCQVVCWLKTYIDVNKANWAEFQVFSLFKDYDDHRFSFCIFQSQSINSVMCTMMK